MTLRLALRALATRPIRSAVLAGGFGLGIAVMANLLGIGEVILEQARSPDLVGGGDVVVWGAGDRLENARFLLQEVLLEGPLGERVETASPSARASVYLVREDGSTTRVWARGGIPSLERALGDRETAGVEAWRDSPADARWTRPDPESLLRSMDRFHPLPRGTRWEDSWAEWLYFNGSADGLRFYLTFFSGPFDADGLRTAGVRFQLERDGEIVNYGAVQPLPEERLLAAAPELDIAGNTIRLDGLRYEIELALYDETRPAIPRPPDLTGRLVLEATRGRSMPPMELRGADGWLSGYTVPVLGGDLAGAITVGGETLSFAGGRGYHDHNWGFWEGVTWQWGQVEKDELSLVYGRVYPPEGVADPERVPGVLAALGPDGPLGFATHIAIEERDAPESGRPQALSVEARGNRLQLRLELTPRSVERTRMGERFFGAGRDFFQLRGDFHVSGTIGERQYEFTQAGSAETFRVPASTEERR